jgi:hypothetical protein
LRTIKQCSGRRRLMNRIASPTHQHPSLQTLYKTTTWSHANWVPLARCQ